LYLSTLVSFPLYLVSLYLFTDVPLS
jgi:hypothetical protein